MFTSTILVIAFALIAFSANTPPPTVEDFTPEMYTGHWFQIGSYPQNFESFCTKCATANYTLQDDGTIKVLNSASNFFGTSFGCTIKGLISPTGTTAQFKLQFDFLNNGHLAGNGQYWIVASGPVESNQYSWAVVSDSDRGLLYILSRTPQLDDEQSSDIDAIVAKYFDPSKLQKTSQEDCKYIN